jgi:phosphoribosyl-ATP pyrophosphohydrolase/phosphoribosyl-AMP cyclohydrolase
MTLQENHIDSLKFDAAGLITTVVQHAHSGEVLMVAWMNRDALALTLQRQRLVFWSRSRQKLWEKGETSGNTLTLVSLTADCDHDTLLARALPAGPVCHTGSATCFGEAGSGVGFLANLQHIIARRASESPESSYTAKLLAAGTQRVAQKVGEEGVELALAATTNDRQKIIDESADLFYHTLVLLRAKDVSLEEVTARLAERHQRSNNSSAAERKL